MASTIAPLTQRKAWQGLVDADAQAVEALHVADKVVGHRGLQGGGVVRIGTCDRAEHQTGWHGSECERAQDVAYPAPDRIRQ